MQTTNNILMIEPVAFHPNLVAAEDNYFQKTDPACPNYEVQQRALAEFKGLHSALVSHGVKVKLFKDIASQETPDSIFPNNWFSTHADSTLVLYPLKALNRRSERREDIIDFLKQRYKRLIDLSSYESKSCYLEGTGSLVLDRYNKTAYACMSQRTTLELLEQWCSELAYNLVRFSSSDSQGHDIYHTNVMMSIGSRLAVVCLESIRDQGEREQVYTSLLETDREVVEISLEQVSQFCGNVLELGDGKSKGLTVMSSSAYHAFSGDQLEILNSTTDIVHSDLSTIERFGGGSARCMIAELF